MTPEKLALAVKLIMSSSKSKIAFNTPVTDSYSNVHSILILECCPKLIKDLIEEGFSLSMGEKGLNLDHYR